MSHSLITAQLVDSSSRHASYTLGPIDPGQVVSLRIEPADAPSFTLLALGPADLPASLLADPSFQDAAMYGYDTGELNDYLDGWGFAPVRVANWIWNTFHWDMSRKGSRIFTLGYILGALARLAEAEHTLALVGLAHFSFLLSLVPDPCPFPAVLGDAGLFHDQAVRAFRDRVSLLKAAYGLDVWDASRLALGVAATWVAGTPLHLVEKERVPLYAQRQTPDAKRQTPNAQR